MEEILRPVIVVLVTVAITVSVGLLVERGLRYGARHKPGVHLPSLRRLQLPLQVLLGTVTLHAVYPLAELELRQDAVIRNFLATAAVIAAVWLVIRATDVVAESLLRRYAQRASEISRVRQLRTQLGLVRRIITSVLVVTTTAVAILLLFPSLRTLGTSMLASAGVIGIIVGVAAQSTLSNLIAGLQIAFGDSVKIGDTVVVEGEWGVVEEITLSFLTVRIWDDRRLTMPVSYFNNKPYENWSRGGSQVTGTVLLHLDHSTPVPQLREHLHTYLRDCPEWDGRNWNLLVTDSTPTDIVVRATMSAADADDAWTLRCAVREELLAWIGRHHAYALPKIPTAITHSVEESRSSDRVGDESARAAAS
ncbi:mechanosensitive ion channel family protein [Nocardia sp. NPDC058705]|uniref:mechanosensitive ion channel family protein n=1 Tax=Nocardia sp. NPDC058705 TaxID=3346609 RepID=UPI00368BA83D